MSAKNKEDCQLDVVVVGSIFMDLICYADRLPKPGETIGGNDFKTGYGGKGANQCVAAQRLGANCSFVGKVGKDAYGHQYHSNLKSEGVNVDCVQTEDGVPTGVASIMVGNDDGQNIIITVAGANGLMTAKYVQDVAETYISKSKVVVVQLEIPTECSLIALQLARKHNVTSIFNVAPALTNLPKEMFSLTDILCLNESEAEIITGLDRISNKSEAEAAIEKLKTDLNCNNVIITLGAAGAILWDNTSKTYLHVNAPKVTAVDTTGAGDCFVGTLANCISKGNDLYSAVQMATVNASDSVLRKGTQSSFPYKLINVN